MSESDRESEAMSFTERERQQCDTAVDQAARQIQRALNAMVRKLPAIAVTSDRQMMAAELVAHRLLECSDPLLTASMMKGAIRWLRFCEPRPDMAKWSPDVDNLLSHLMDVFNAVAVQSDDRPHPRVTVEEWLARQETNRKR